MVTRLPARGCCFVTLSYVWVTERLNTKGQLTDKSRENFETPGGLKDVPDTIQDAMQVCIQLGERFLWVDRLCIIQDSSDKLHQIKLIDQIYSSADFVIVAACRKGAKDGLRGVSKPRAELHTQARDLDLQFTFVFPGLSTILRSSI